MRLSNYLYSTMKDTPKEAEIPSHQLMLRAGLINQLSSGVYSYLPLGLKVLRKIENIIREELNKIGAHELLLPVIQPRELWEQSGRWEKMQDLMFTLHDKNEREYCLGPTHEEVITDLFKKIVKSYKNLPVSLYQIQLKYRDEIRPRFGVMRSREFIMKDAYSFHKDKKSLDEIYKDFYNAYCNIFKRLGLKFRVVDADSGDIGGSVSHEFMVLAGTGEDDIIYCDNCQYASNVEKAKGRFPEREEKARAEKINEIHTPDVFTIKDMERFFEKNSKDFIKCVVFRNEENKIFLCLIRGDLEINEIKLNHYIPGKFTTASEQDLQDNFNTGKGFVGPVNIDDNITVIADVSLKNGNDFITGANKKDYHISGINISDLKIHKFADIHVVDERFKCISCGEDVKIERGIETGHIFQLEDKYSKTSNTTFTGENGKEQNVLMGCYGIGVSRTLAAAIEQNYDEKGIIWPESIAPYLITVIPVDIKKSEWMSGAEKIYSLLLDNKFDTIIDDRPYRAGFKFKDSDLTGIPYKIIVGKKYSQNSIVEIEKRNGEKFEVHEDDIITFFKERN